MESHMHHHSSGSGDSHSNGIFGNSILPLGTNSTEPNRLVVVLEGLDVVSAFEDTIVSVV
jgi:hypothetical protein